MAYTLPPLPYAFNALEPHIDAKTMEIHHDKHHQTYVTKLNEALEGLNELSSMSIEDLLMNIDKVPADKKQAVINHGGGHANHTLFWEIMSPAGGGKPFGKLADAINTAFGSYEQFIEEFEKAAVSRFGSGWAWLALDENGENLHIGSTANQDSPYLEKHIPLLGIDVWEHAYYLKYQNLRPDYIKAWWNVLDWNKIQERFEKFSK